MDEKLTRYLSGVALIGVLGVLVSACGSGSSVRTASRVTSSPASGHPISASRITNYDTLASLGADSSLVVAGTAGASTRVSIAGLAFTVTDVKISSVDKHASPISVGSTIRVRQTGTSSDSIDTDSLSPILEPGQKYLLYLQVFVGPDGTTTDQYIIVGNQGIWKSDGPAFGLAVSNSKLPRHVKLAPDGVARVQD